MKTYHIVDAYNGRLTDIVRACSKGQAKQIWDKKMMSQGVSLHEVSQYRAIAETSTFKRKKKGRSDYEKTDTH